MKCENCDQNHGESNIDEPTGTGKEVTNDESLETKTSKASQSHFQDDESDEDEDIDVDEEKDAEKLEPSSKREGREGNNFCIEYFSKTVIHR